MTKRTLLPVFLLAAATLAGCGSWGRVGQGPKPAQPGETLTQALDLGTAFRKIGRISAGAPLPFVADVAIYGGPGDSALAIVGISLENRNLSFTRENAEFVARYQVTITARPADSTSRAPVSLTRDQSVRVASFNETQRADESVLFQEGLTLTPGKWIINVLIRDPGVANTSTAERSYEVPAFKPGSLSAPQLAYQVRARGTRASPMSIILNPRGMMAYGGDSANIYVEGYNMPGPRTVPIRLVDLNDSVLYVDSLRFTGGREVESQVLRYSAENAPLGQIRIVAGAGADSVSTGALVSFSSSWVVTNFEDMIAVLRWYPQSAALDSLRKAKPEDRARAWRAFWTATDPVPGTPGHEGLDAYFRRVALANIRYRDEGIMGWRTDRGEVLIRLGEPDEVYSTTPNSSPRNAQTYVVRWTYTSYQLDLYFVDETGFGRFRLDTASRAEFERVVSRVERALPR